MDHFISEVAMFAFLKNLFAPRVTRRPSPIRRGFGIESLESRQLLAADLTIASEDLISIEPNGANVHISAQMFVLNAGDQGLIANNVHLEGVLSSDLVFGNADDVLVDLDLLDLNLPAGTVANGNISGNVSLASYQAANFLLIKIDSDTDINEANENNNVALMSLPDLPTLTTSPGQTSGKTNRVVRVDPGIQFTDSASQKFSGGALHVLVDNDVGDNNVLSVKRIRTESGVLRRRQNELRLGSTVIGTIQGGTNSQQLIITFTGDVGRDEIQSIASAVSLKGKKGVTGVRDVQFFVVEPEVVTGFVAVKQVLLT